MLKPKKKITKKEIKQDTLVTSYAKLTTFYDANKKYFNYAFTALIVIVVAIVIYTNNRKANNEKAATELGKILPIYEATTNDPTQIKLAIDGVPERGIMGLKAIVDNYGSTSSGEIARLYLANCFLSMGNYDEALKNFDDFDSSNDLLNASAKAGLASCYEAKGDYKKAAVEYEKAASTFNNEINTPDYLLSAAICYGKAGEKEKAVSILKHLKKEFPKSSNAREADRYISQFSIS